MMTLLAEILGAVLAALALWDHATSTMRLLLTPLVATRHVDEETARVVISYLTAVARHSPSEGASYGSHVPFVRPLGRHHRVFFQHAVISRRVFWLRKRPVWFTRRDAGENIEPMWLSYLRGTFDFERLLLDAALWEHGRGADDAPGFSVTVHGGDPSGDRNKVTTTESRSTPVLANPATGNRIVGWSVADLGEPARLGLDAMSLSPGAQAATERVARWLRDRLWFEARGIPWRLGLLLSGPPGTGKTALARAIAVEHDVPLHAIDLAGLNNFSLRAAWANVVGDAPCVALFEDIDCVFAGRELVHDGVEVTFDCLLNCIAGVAAADGVLVVVTTNRVDLVDPALTRGGRLDLRVEIGALDRAGRVKMARRILGRDFDDLVDAHDGATPSAFQEVLCAEALRRRADEIVSDVRE